MTPGRSEPRHCRAATPPTSRPRVSGGQVTVNGSKMPGGSCASPRSTTIADGERSICNCSTRGWTMRSSSGWPRSVRRHGFHRAGRLHPGGSAPGRRGHRVPCAAVRSRHRVRARARGPRPARQPLPDEGRHPPATQLRLRQRAPARVRRCSRAHRRDRRPNPRRALRPEETPPSRRAVPAGTVAGHRVPVAPATGTTGYTRPVTVPGWSPLAEDRANRRGRFSAGRRRRTRVAKLAPGKSNPRNWFGGRAAVTTLTWSFRRCARVAC